MDFIDDNIVLVTRLPYTLGDYRDAVNGQGLLSYEWSDKPHRLVYDLIKEIKDLHGKISKPT